MAFFYPTSTIELRGKSILIPIVSTANVGQLAVDLIIGSLNLEQIGVFDPQYFIPVVGGREDGKNGITTPLELYGKSELNFVIIQQRSPALKAKKEAFVQELLHFIASSDFCAALFLSGVDPSSRTDAQMFTPTHQIHLPGTPNIAGTPLHNLGNLPIPIYSSPVQQNPVGSLDTTAITPNESHDIPFVPGGGLTRRLLTSISNSGDWKIPTGALLQFVLEGDNRADAALFASVVAKTLGINQLNESGSWKQPSSWSYGLFGAPHDQNLYG
ncbi:PAC2 family-domain-containing protein [Crepidotus variabilis]|uniref:Proteasome assembly chaperone 2 n=1 Tax=Crepidotus variabilis TaxID=179855 RepID=A0A9P6JK96_9AGAR|nr:PAC2 family-domain-containing protein [Crepidotus variabilis]